MPASISHAFLSIYVMYNATYKVAMLYEEISIVLADIVINTKNINKHRFE